jgi:mRNA interferase MazF
MQPTRGEVWLFDLGMAAKTRPVLVVSVAYGDADRAIVTVVPHTTQLRGSPFEVSVRAPFLQHGAFLVQGISTHPKAWAIRRIGVLTRDQMAEVMAGLRNWLGLTPD